MIHVRDLFYVKQLKKASLVKYNMNIHQNKERKLIWLAYRGNAIRPIKHNSKALRLKSDWPVWGTARSQHIWTEWGDSRGWLRDCQLKQTKAKLNLKFYSLYIVYSTDILTNFYYSHYSCLIIFVFIIFTFSLDSQKRETELGLISWFYFYDCNFATTLYLLFYQFCFP